MRKTIFSIFFMLILSCIAVSAGWDLDWLSPVGVIDAEYYPSSSTSINFSFNYTATAITLNPGNSANCSIINKSSRTGSYGILYSTNLTNDTFFNYTATMTEGRVWYYSSCKVNGVYYNSSERLMDIDVDYYKECIGENCAINLSHDSGNAQFAGTVTINTLSVTDYGLVEDDIPTLSSTWDNTMDADRLTGEDYLNDRITIQGENISGGTIDNARISLVEDEIPTLSSTWDYTMDADRLTGEDYLNDKITIQGENISGGTIAEARIHSDIARDSEVESANGTMRDHVESNYFNTSKTATPSTGDTTNISTAKQIYDWVIGLSYVANAWDALTDMTLNSKQIYIGNSSNNPVGRTITGDIVVGEDGSINVTNTRGLGAENLTSGTVDNARISLVEGEIPQITSSWANDMDADQLVGLDALNEKITITGPNITDGNIALPGYNLTGDNVWFPTMIYTHTNVNISVGTGGEWYNITFSEQEAPIKSRITHTYSDGTNDTFTIVDTGVYELLYTFSFQDLAASPAGHIVSRVIQNGIEINGSLLETDTSKQNADTLISHSSILAELTAADEIKFQFTADDTSIQMYSHATYGTHRDGGVISIKRIG